MNKDTNLSHMLHSHRRLFFVVTGLIVFSVVVHFLTHRGKNSVATVPEVLIAQVDTSKVEVYGDYDGHVLPGNEVEIHSRVEGYVEKILFHGGAYVKKGQILFVIDPDIYKANLDRSSAQLDKAKAVLRKAERDLNRIKPLYSQNAASQLDLDNAQAALECARADVAICQANLCQAQLDIAATRVKAPISGYVSESKVDVGALVGPSGGSSQLASVVRCDSVIVDFSMTSLDYLKSIDRNVDIDGVRDGSDSGKVPSFVTVTLPDGSRYPNKGIVVFADPHSDAKHSSFSVRAIIPNPDCRLRPGTDTKVRMLLDVMEHPLSVPSVAVQKEDGDCFVYVVDADGVVSRRPVTLKTVVNDKAVLSDGIAPGEFVALERFEILSDGVVINKKLGK